MAKIDAILERAQSLTDNEKFEEAYNILKAAYNEGKGNAEFLEKIALAASTLEKKDEAINYWEQLIDVAPNSMVAYTELQDAYYDTNRYKYYLTRAKVKTLNNQVAQAISDYKKAVENTQDKQEKIEAEILIAKGYEYIGKIMSAIDEYSKIAPSLKSADIYIKIADLYLYEKDKYSAISILEKAIEIYPEDNRVRNLLSELYLETGNTERALKYAVSELLKIRIILSEGKNDKAYELLQSVSDKNNGEYHKLFAEYYFNKKDWENCRKSIEEFSKFEPGHPLIYQMLSLVCEGENKMENAHINRAKMYIAKGQKDIALHEFMQAHNINHTNIQTIEEIIKLCEESSEKHTAAEFCEKLIKLEPNNERALIKLGDFYFDIGEYNAASRYYESAAQVTHKADTFLKAGKCFEKLRRLKTAKEYYQRYLEKAPLSNNAENEIIKAKVAKLSSERVIQEDEGFLEKLLGFFNKDKK